MRKYQWILVVALIGCVFSFSGCKRIQKVVLSEVPEPRPAEMVTVPTEPVVPMLEPETPAESPMGPVDVLIYTGSTWWITPQAATIEAETTKSLLQSAGIQVEITESEESVNSWMLQTTANDSVNVLISYGVIPNSVYPRGNSQPDGSIAENWIETPDGDTILNQADYLGWNSTDDSERLGVPPEEWNINNLPSVGSNEGRALQNLMDIPNISLFPIGPPSVAMSVTPDGNALTPSLVNFASHRPLPLNQLQGEWFAEKVFASDTGTPQATYADPVIVRDGNRGRLAMVHQTALEDNPKGEVAAEIIINYLLSK